MLDCHHRSHVAENYEFPWCFLLGLCRVCWTSSWELLCGRRFQLPSQSLHLASPPVGQASMLIVLVILELITVSSLHQKCFGCCPVPWVASSHLSTSFMHGLFSFSLSRHWTLQPALLKDHHFTSYFASEIKMFSSMNPLPTDNPSILWEQRGQSPSDPYKRKVPWELPLL